LFNNLKWQVESEQTLLITTSSQTKQRSRLGSTLEDLSSEQQHSKHLKELRTLLKLAGFRQIDFN